MNVNGINNIIELKLECNKIDNPYAKNYDRIKINGMRLRLSLNFFNDRVELNI